MKNENKTNELLCAKELAVAIKRTPRYIYAMRRDGFRMPGGLSTVERALRWLARHPDFRQNKPASGRQRHV